MILTAFFGRRRRAASPVAIEHGMGEFYQAGGSAPVSPSQASGPRRLQMMVLGDFIAFARG